MSLPFTHFISTKQLTKADAVHILDVATSMKRDMSAVQHLLSGKILASLFYEPSTRTRLSFEAAMLRLGGEVISAEGIQFSSLYKGETIEDTMRMVSSYADIIAMRHPEQGIAERAIQAASVPFINAGDGPGQHPTQAMLDLFTIREECGRLEDLHIACVGDLRFGRTVHSLTYVLGLFPNIRFTFVSPAELTLPEKVTSFLEEHRIPWKASENISDAVSADVLYMTRVQQERFTDRSEYERLKDRFVLHADLFSQSSPVILHPLPRVNEIHESVDALPNAAYFRQAKNGLYTRMALLALLLKAL